MKFWSKLLNTEGHMYVPGDRVRLRTPHSEGDEVTILEQLPYKQYKIYIPYWDYFRLDEDDIIEKIDHWPLKAKSQE